jgi:parallel beta-helix repeat protein
VKGKKFFIAILVWSLILNVTVLTYRTVESEPRVITVPDEYSTIQAAVSAANAGDVVFVRSGIYAEHIVIDKSMSVTGENADTTVVDGSSSGTVVTVAAGNVSVSSFTVQNGETGIDVTGSGANVSSNVVASNGVFETDTKADFEIYQDPLTVVWHRHYDLIEGSYTELFHVASETPLLIVGVFGHEDVQLLMLGIFYDENMDGVPQLNEVLGFASIDLNTWVCVLGPPLGQYIIKVHGFAVSGSPGHFDRQIVTYRGSGIAVRSSSNSIVAANLIEDNYAGVFIQSSTNVSVKSNIITHNIAGIVTSTSTNSLISGNSLFLNDPDYGFGTAIALRDVRDTNVTSNFLSHNSFGINVWNSSAVTVQENQLEWHDGWGIELHRSVDSSVVNNNVTEVAGLDGIRLMFSSGNNLTRNNLTACEHSGILYWYDNFNNTATFNALQYSGVHNYLDGHGVEVLLSANNTFAYNTFENGNNQGLLTIESDNNTIVENLVLSNRKGIVLRSSARNRVYHNSIINNSDQQGYDDTGQNFWSNGYPSGGNYWADQTGQDVRRGVNQSGVGSDGILDEPYSFDFSYDGYPLVKPYGGTRDVGTKLTISRTIIPESYNLTLTINGTIINHGLQTENLDITIWTNSMSIAQTLSLTERNSTLLVLMWNTTNEPRGHYLATITADQVPGEIDTTDNSAAVWIVITFPGDVTGASAEPDFKVDMRDIGTICAKFGTTSSQTGWNVNIDANSDSVVNMRDIGVACDNFGRHD